MTAAVWKKDEELTINFNVKLGLPVNRLQVRDNLNLEKIR